MNASTFVKQVGLSIGGSLLVYVVLAAVFARDAALNSTGLTRGMLEQYGSLAFEEQVDLLLKNQDDERVALYMLGHICRHGERAYRVLLPFLREERSDLGRELAGQGIWRVHGWSYDLKNSEALSILESMLKQRPERYWLRAAIFGQGPQDTHGMSWSQAMLWHSRGSYVGLGDLITKRARGALWGGRELTSGSWRRIVVRSSGGGGGSA